MGLFAEVDGKVDLLANDDSVDIGVITGLEVDGTSGLYAEGKSEGARSAFSSAGSLKLISFSFLEASELSRVCLLVGEVLLVLSGSLLNHFDLFLIITDFLEEVLFDCGKLFFELRSFIVIFLLLSRSGLGGQFLGDVEGLLSSEFSLEYLEHDFLLSRLEMLIVKGRAKL
jgi:hypothetical protein